VGQFSELWMYCKETFEVVRRRLFLFVPRLLMVGLIFVFIMLTVGTILVKGLSGGGMFGLPLALVVFTGLFMLVHLMVESGQINLFAKAASGNSVGMQDFREGVRRFTGRVFVGSVLYLLIILITGFIMVMFFAIPFLNILAIIGAFIVMLGISVFLSAWKAALVFKDLGAAEAFGDSYRFAKEYFWPLALVVFVRGLFDGNNNNRGQGGGQGGGLNIGGFDVNLNLPGVNMLGMDTGSMMQLGSIMALMAVIPLAAFAALVTILVTVYLDQLVFVIYARRENLG